MVPKVLFEVGENLSRVATVGGHSTGAGGHGPF